MGITIEEFVAELGWDIDSSDLKDFKKQVKGVYDDVAKLTKYVLTGSAALAGMTVLVNNATAEQTNLARSVGASAETVNALSAALGGLGFNSDNVVDLIEELNNKFGELGGLGEMSSATDALKILNLNFQDLKDLAPEEQFIKILDAAKSLGDYQQAVSAVDMLMGGEANKVLGHLRTLDGSLGDIVERYKQLSFLTDEGRAGALRFSQQWKDLTLVGKSVSQEFFGRLGKELAPLSEEILNWVANNKDVINEEVVTWATRFGEAIKELADAIGSINNVVHELGGYKTVITSVGVAFAAWKVFPLLEAVLELSYTIPKLGQVANGINNVGTALAGLKFARFAAFLGLVGISYLFFQDLWVSLKGGKSAFSGLHDDLGKTLSSFDEFWAGMLNMPVDEYRAKMLDGIQAVQDGISDFHGFLVADFEGLISTVDKGVDAVLEDINAFIDKIKWLADKAKQIWGADFFAVGATGKNFNPSGPKSGAAKSVEKGVGTLLGLSPEQQGPVLTPSASPAGVPPSIVINPSEGLTITPGGRMPAQQPEGGTTQDNRVYHFETSTEIKGNDRDTQRALLRDFERSVERSISHALRSAGGD